MPLLDARGEVIGICGINKDFTAMKCMQDALEEERDRLKTTIAELEAKNALLQADLQLAREIGILTAGEPKTTEMHRGDREQSWETHRRETRVPAESGRRFPEAGLDTKNC